MAKRRRNPNRGVVLALADAAAIHRMWELRERDRRFFNPIEAYEAGKAERVAMMRLEDKLIAIFAAHELAGSMDAVDPVDRVVTG